MRARSRWIRPAIASWCVLLLAGCAALSGLGSLDEVDCTTTSCDDGGNGGGNGRDGDATSASDATPNKDAATSDASVKADAGVDATEEYDPAIPCGGGTCQGAMLECCFDTTQPLSDNCANIGGCILGTTVFELQCGKRSNCQSNEVCCLHTDTHEADCESLAQCLAPNEQLCASAIECASGSCLPSAVLTSYDSCH